MFLVGHACSSDSLHFHTAFGCPALFFKIAHIPYLEPVWLQGAPLVQPAFRHQVHCV